MSRILGLSLEVNEGAFSSKAILFRTGSLFLENRHFLLLLLVIFLLFYGSPLALY